MGAPDQTWDDDNATQTTTTKQQGTTKTISDNRPSGPTGGDTTGEGKQRQLRTVCKGVMFQVDLDHRSHRTAREPHDTEARQHPTIGTWRLKIRLLS